MKKLLLIIFILNSTILMAGDGHGMGGGMTMRSFRMTGDGIDDGFTRNGPHVPFWEMIKEADDPTGPYFPEDLEESLELKQIENGIIGRFQ